jgi:diguanylate cyclase (GGDEF)-like protein
MVLDGRDPVIGLLIALAVMVLAVIILVLIASRLHARAKAAARQEQETRLALAASDLDLATLRAALDQVKFGIVLLDQERRAQFINRAFRSMWRLPDELADSKPTFVKLMYHSRDDMDYAAPQHQIGAYVTEQMALIRAGDGRPLDIRLANGQVLRFRCTALPDGGRFLSYGNVGDLVSHADMLQELASIDGLTGLYNRRQLLALAESEWERFKRYGRPLALLMLDIDLFKSVNDRFGHDVGDRVIKAVADVLRTNKRSSDIVGRIGGEEFALLLPEATLDSAIAAGERFRRAVAKCIVATDGGAVPITITISIGVSVVRDGVEGIAQLMKQADVALYEAKRTGRNRVCTFRQPAASNQDPPKQPATAA